MDISLNNTNTESSLVALDQDDLNSKNSLIDFNYNPSLVRLPGSEKKEKRGKKEKKEKKEKEKEKKVKNEREKEKEKKTKTKNINISSINNSNNDLKIGLGSSLYHMSSKNKRKKEINKSTNYIFENKEKREIQVGLKSIKIDDDILKKKDEVDNKRYERSSKSIKKKKNKSITNHIYKIDDDNIRADSPSNKQDNLNINANNNVYNNNDKEEHYYGEKILINLNDLKSIFSKYKETNNIVDYKKEALSEENTYYNTKRISCIINNSPFICSNIYLKKKCDTSIECLLGKEKCRTFEKNKNNNKNKNYKDLFKLLSDDIFQEVDFTLNDKLYNIDPTKISIGQLYQKDDNCNNEFLKNRHLRDIKDLDGNSFIKAFMFNYLEQLIVKKDIKKLTEIIGKIILVLKSQKETKDKISKVLAVFKLIINYIEQDNVSNAYKILIKSFSEDYNFEKCLIIFIREALSESITLHHKYFNIDYLKEIIQDKYIKTNDKNELYFDHDSYIKDNITNNNNELQYELLIYYFLPFIFDIDLVIYTDNDTKTNKILFKHTNIDYDQNNIITIELFIKFGGVSIIYTENYYKDNIDLLPLISMSKLPVDKIKKKENENKINCYMCHKIPYEFMLIDKTFQLICQNCLIDVIRNIIDKRYLLFSDTDNHYFHEEYYCNKINYNINKDKVNSYELNISINDIRHVLPNNSDISNEIHKKILKSFKCGRCKDYFNKSKYAFTMDKCGHLVCINCLKDYIIKATDEKVILNYYEYKLNQIKFFCPICDKEINLSKNMISNIFTDEVYINKAEERLIDAAKIMCCFCHTNNKSKVKSKFKRFVIINDFSSSNSSVENYLLIHSMCDDCAKNIKKNDLINSSKNFFCDFCGETHLYKKIKFDIQRKRKACCTHM